jgi:hypothetical protein
MLHLRDRIYKQNSRTPANTGHGCLNLRISFAAIDNPASFRQDGEAWAGYRQLLCCTKRLECDNGFWQSCV